MFALPLDSSSGGFYANRQPFFFLTMWYDASMSLTITQIKRKAVPILKKAGVKRSALFGSVVRGEATKKSDVDMLVDLPRSVGLLDFIGLEQELEDVLHRKVDLVEYHMLKPRIRDRILNERISLYGERSTRVH